MSQPLPRKTIRAQRNLFLALVAVAIGAAALFIGGKWLLRDRNYVTTDNAFVAGNLIPVYSDATGVVAQVLAEDTQAVKKGDALLRLDGQRAVAALAQAEGELSRAARSVSALFATRRQICEKIASRGASRDRARHDLARYQQASPSGSVSQQVLQNAKDQLAALEADLREARAEQGTLESRVTGVTRATHPDVEAAKAKFLDAAIELARQNIRAPASGVVAKRKAQVGQRVKPGDQLMTIVPLDHLWVEANVWENRLERIRPGQPAVIEADIYGSRAVYHGVVEGIAAGAGQVFALLPPDNATGNFIHIVQRVPVRIGLQADELEKQPLRPGLSTVASIDVSGAGAGPGASMVKIESGEYRTEIYDRDLADAKARAEKIVKDNFGPINDGVDGACQKPE